MKKKNNTETMKHIPQFLRSKNELAKSIRK
ncbi:MAG: hypothetical protein ACI8W8_004063 [Rhodothermales bacterium]|jgi:hypothetical protein